MLGHAQLSEIHIDWDEQYDIPSGRTDFVPKTFDICHVCAIKLMTVLLHNKPRDLQKDFARQLGLLWK
jgi:hypothetical protein